MSDTGERGPIGDIGHRGEAGERGEPGKTGATGKTGALSRHVTASFVAIVVISFVVLAVMGYTINQNRDLGRKGQQAHDAICTLKGDLQRRIQASRDFLKEHPNGIPGIPPSLIRNGIDNQQKTLDALSPVRCTTREREPTTTNH